MSTYSRIKKSQQISGLLQSNDIAYKESTSSIARRNTTVTIPSLNYIAYGSLSNFVIYTKGSGYSYGAQLVLPEPDQIDGTLPSYEIFFGLSQDSLNLVNGGSGHVVGDKYIVYSDTSKMSALIIVDSIDTNGSITNFRVERSGHGFDNSEIYSDIYIKPLDNYLDLPIEDVRQGYSPAIFELVPDQFCISKINMLSFGSGYAILDNSTNGKKTYFIYADSSGSGFLAYTSVGFGYKNNNSAIFREYNEARNRNNNVVLFDSSVDIVSPIITYENISDNIAVLATIPPDNPPPVPECLTIEDFDQNEPNTNDSGRAIIGSNISGTGLNTAGVDPAQIAAIKSAMALIANQAWLIYENMSVRKPWDSNPTDANLAKTVRRLLIDLGKETDPAKIADIKIALKGFGEDLSKKFAERQKFLIQDFIFENKNRIDFSKVGSREYRDMLIQTILDAADSGEDYLNRRGRGYVGRTSKTYYETLGELVDEIIQTGKKLYGTPEPKPWSPPPVPKTPSCPRIIPGSLPDSSLPPTRYKPKQPKLTAGKAAIAAGAIALLVGLGYKLADIVSNKPKPKPEQDGDKHTEIIRIRKPNGDVQVITKIFRIENGRLIFESQKIEIQKSKNKPVPARKQSGMGVLIDGGFYVGDVLLSIPWSSPEIFINHIIDPPQLGNSPIDFETHKDECLDLVSDYLAGKIPDDVMQILLDHDVAYYDDDMNGGYVLRGALLDLLSVPYDDFYGPNFDLEDVRQQIEDMKQAYNDGFLDSALHDALLDAATEYNKYNELIEFLNDENGCSLCDEDLRILMNQYNELVLPIGVSVPINSDIDPEISP